MNQLCNSKPCIGVGLRHSHYEDALAFTAPIDFVEVHSENFYAAGGAALSTLEAIRSHYDVSLHSTALGLGSAKGIPPLFIAQLKELLTWVDPILVSDHASYAWSFWDGKPIHAGDLLPLKFNEDNLRVLADNVTIVQHELQRQLLVENLSSYLIFEDDEMTEVEFLIELTNLTGCGLLVDLNNILVSAHNQQIHNKLEFGINWLNSIPKGTVKELHLAGHSDVSQGELIIDDHSQPIAKECWQLYKAAVSKFGNLPTLIEWDNNLPNWQTLINEALKAKQIGIELHPSVAEN